MLTNQIKAEIRKKTLSEGPNPTIRWTATVALQAHLPSDMIKKPNDSR